MCVKCLVGQKKSRSIQQTAWGSIMGGTTNGECTNGIWEVATSTGIRNGWEGLAQGLQVTTWGGGRLYWGSSETKPPHRFLPGGIGLVVLVQATGVERDQPETWWAGTNKVLGKMGRAQCWGKTVLRIWAGLGKVPRLPSHCPLGTTGWGMVCQAAVQTRPMCLVLGRPVEVFSFRQTG